MKSFGFSKEGFESAKKRGLERFIDRNKRVLKTTGTVLVLNSTPVYAKSIDAAGWKFVGIARQGLFWVCLTVRAVKRLL